jgi:hypothetical protein
MLTQGYRQNQPHIQSIHTAHPPQTHPLANAIASGRTLAEITGGIPRQHGVEYDGEVGSDASGDSYGVASAFPPQEQHGRWKQK